VDRLRTASEVDDGQTRVRQTDEPLLVKSMPVRSAMVERGNGAFQFDALRRGATCVCKYSGYTAHGSSGSATRFNGVAISCRPAALSRLRNA
jgi:hypothetical protein